MEVTENANSSRDVEDTFNTSGFATPLAPSRTVHFLAPTPVSRSRKRAHAPLKIELDFSFLIHMHVFRESSLQEQAT